MDFEGISPLDLVLKDRAEWDCKGNGPPKGPTEVYAWGCNLNYNLGFENQHGPDNPEVVESLRRIKTPVVDVRERINLRIPQNPIIQCTSSFIYNTYSETCVC